MASALTTAKGEYVVYPYPVTPWHADYAHHADLVEAAKARAAAGPVPRIRLLKGFAGLAAGPAWRAADGEWDATIEEVPLAALLRDESASLNGWTSPPWLKEGWFHAHALAARAVTDPAARSAIEYVAWRAFCGWVLLSHFTARTIGSD